MIISKPRLTVTARVGMRESEYNLFIRLEKETGMMWRSGIPAIISFKAKLFDQYKCGAKEPESNAISFEVTSEEASEVSKLFKVIAAESKSESDAKCLNIWADGLSMSGLKPNEESVGTFASLLAEVKEKFEIASDLSEPILYSLFVFDYRDIKSIGETGDSVGYTALSEEDKDMIAKQVILDQWQLADEPTLDTISDSIGHYTHERINEGSGDGL